MAGLLWDEGPVALKRPEELRVVVDGNGRGGVGEDDGVGGRVVIGALAVVEVCALADDADDELGGLARQRAEAEERVVHGAQARGRRVRDGQGLLRRRVEKVGAVVRYALPVAVRELADGALALELVLGGGRGELGELVDEVGLHHRGAEVLEERVEALLEVVRVRLVRDDSHAEAEDAARPASAAADRVAELLLGAQLRVDGLLDGRLDELRQHALAKRVGAELPVHLERARRVLGVARPLRHHRRRPGGKHADHRRRHGRGGAVRRGGDILAGAEASDGVRGGARGGVVQVARDKDVDLGGLEGGAHAASQLCGAEDRVHGRGLLLGGHVRLG
mmetsp:Transcript_11649/g.38948  ORF Transcript_11649/g.38948 Transcript_11649/m.38948 type:complete len:335 (+) Transcript_11649:655-1659(+)